MRLYFCSLNRNLKKLQFSSVFQFRLGIKFILNTSIINIAILWCTFFVKNKKTHRITSNRDICLAYLFSCFAWLWMNYRVSSILRKRVSCNDFVFALGLHIIFTRSCVTLYSWRRLYLRLSLTPPRKNELPEGSSTWRKGVHEPSVGVGRVCWWRAGEQVY